MTVILYQETQWRGTSEDVPLALGTINTYVAGTSTPLATYTNGGGLTVAANPLVLDAYGRANNGNGIWLTEGSTYKFVVKNAAGAIIHTIDNIAIGNYAPASIPFVSASLGSAASGTRQLTATSPLSLVDGGVGSTLAVTRSGFPPVVNELTSTGAMTANSMSVGTFFRLTVASSTLAVNTNNLSITSSYTELTNSSGGTLNITGIAAVTGGVIYLAHVSGSPFSLVVASASSTAANRFMLVGKIIYVGECVRIIYATSSSRWLIVE